MSRETIRVLVVDDHSVVRAGIRALLAEVPDISVVGDAAEGESAVRLAVELRPDVVLMDLVMPGVDGIEAIARIVSDCPESRILALTSFSEDDKVFPAIKAGALGYLLKDTEPADLVRAVREVHRGESSLHPSVARRVLKELGTPLPSPGEGMQLTAREIEVLKLVARGLTNLQIGAKLFVSEATVRTHVSHILSKLHMANRVQATLYALKTGLAQLDSRS